MKQFDIPEQIDDSFIIQFFSLQNKNKINPSRTKESFIKRFINISNYLTNRFIDSDSFLETIYRIWVCMNSEDSQNINVSFMVVSQQ